MSLYKTYVKKIPISADKKTKQKDYLSQGALPIIDQGHVLIGGYTDDVSKQIPCNLPVIVFGDHTKAVKYINFPFGAGADGIKILEPKEGVNPLYLYYRTIYLTYKIEDKGYARHYQYIEKAEVSIPPLEEQERIVARIEELFSELDKVVEMLKTTKEQLAVYRQAVLKEAFSSHLYEERVLGDFIEKPRYGTSKKCDSDFNIGKVPVFRIPNIDYRVGKIIHEDLKYADFSKEEKKTLSLKENDILMIRSNGSVGLVGRAALVQLKDTDGLFAGYLIRLRIVDQTILYPQYLLYWLSSYEVRSYVEQVAKSTNGVNNINSSEISRIPIHICELKAQREIVEQIESRLSVCGSIEQTVDTALQQAEAMRQSILKQAFEGRLL